MQEADTCTEYDQLDGIDPETVTMKGIIDRIVQRKGKDPNNVTAELYTQEGLPLSNSPFVVDCELFCIKLGSMSK